MSGSQSRARNKKLVRSVRLSGEEYCCSSEDEDYQVDGGLDTPTRAARGHPGMATPQHNPWHRAAVRAVELQESRKIDKFTKNGNIANNVGSNHVKANHHTGNGSISGLSSVTNSDVIPPPPLLPGGVPQPPPQGITPPPAAWSDEPTERDSQHGTDTESMPSSSHSSVLVDMGKVVGVLRTYPHLTNNPGNDLEDSDNPHTVGDEEESVGEDLSEDEEVPECASCVREAKGIDSEVEDSLCGDPLVYATFVTPVQQYSTETEPSRQPSFNSRQPSFNSRQPSFNERQQSFKQNSTEGEVPQTEVVNCLGLPGLVVPGVAPATDAPSDSDIYKDEVRDIYEEVPMDQWPPPSGPVAVFPDVQEVSTAELNHQVNQERLSFIHSQGSRDDPDYDQVPLPPPPLPAKLVHPHNQGRSPPNQTSGPQYDARESMCPLPAPSQYRPTLGTLAQQSSSYGQWGSGEDSEGDAASTIKRKSKRDRNKTVNNSEGRGGSGHGNDTRHNHAKDTQSLARRSKSRSKSRSPGREIDRAIVIVHHTTCSHSHSRGTSPDNLSESSISFHENEVHDISPCTDIGKEMPPEPWYDNPSSNVPRDQLGSNVPRDLANLSRDPHSLSRDSVNMSRDSPHVSRDPLNMSRDSPHVSRDSPHVSRDPASMSRDPSNMCRDPVKGSEPPRLANLQYSNWESCRESWFSSGSECRPPSYTDSANNSGWQPPQQDHSAGWQPPQDPSDCPPSSTKAALTYLSLNRKEKAGTPRLGEAQGGLGEGSQTLPRARNEAHCPTAVAPPRQLVLNQHRQSNRDLGLGSNRDLGQPRQSSIGPRMSSRESGLGPPRQSSRESGTGSSSSRPSSRPGTRPPTRSHSPGGSLATAKHSGSLQLHKGSRTVLSRDSTPDDDVSSGLSGTPVLDSDQEVGCPDLLHQEPLTEDAFIANLHHRFKRDHIYSWISTVLVSINPYKKLSLYTPDVIDAYRNHCRYQLPPHIYSLADRAWHELRERNCDQCILMTGESGAGKTEAGKLVLQYIAAVTGHAKEFHNIKYQLLQSNPVLEAFGNAKTKHNDNSSRFGKYIEVSFDFKGDPAGGSITNYLMEKSRVTHHTTTERNFHIFYQILGGADIHLLKELKLQRNSDSYALLRSEGGRIGEGSSGWATPGPGDRPGPPSGSRIDIDDRRDFQITKKAMEDLGFTQEESSDVFKIVAATLKLGNLNFVPTTNMDGTEGCSISNEYELYEVGELLGGVLNDLRIGLLERTSEINSKSDIIVTDISAGEAADSRDALCRTLYSRLFTWLVSRINELIKVKTPRKHKVLGILDIYGFEAFEHNGFEQFIINFSNEKLQQVFIDWTFKLEQEEYLQEGVEWTQVGYFSNSVICNLIERNNHGILAQLDEACLRPLASSCVGPGGGIGANLVSDQQLLENLNETFSHHAHYEPAHNKNNNIPTESNTVPATCFRIKHYAGSVTYDVQNFLEKNADHLDRELSKAMFQCQHPLLKILFPEGNVKRATRRRPATVGTQFKISIGALVNNLGSKSPHFVRCVKPNENKVPRVFDTALVQHQVRYLGLVELAKLRKTGFVFRQQYDIFLERFKMLSLHTWPVWRGSPVEGVTYLLRDLPLSANEYAFGRTKIFIRSAKTVEQLDEFRQDRLEELATLIQKCYRGYRARRNWTRLKESQKVISNYWKKWKDKSHISDLKQRRQQEWAVVVIQRYYLCWQRKRWLLKLANNLPSESPICREWPRSPKCLKETSFLIRKLYHKWRCHRFRLRFDQTSRNRMREKVTASLIFKDRKSSYPRSVRHPFYGDHVGIRRNPLWKDTLQKNSLHKMDKYIVFSDIVNKINRSNGKFVPILFVISTSSMLILDQRTMQIKYRVPASEILRLSLSPYFDDIAVFHVRATSPTRELRSQANIPGCLSSEAVKRKGDFVFQTGHVIEIVTKLFLVIQNATGKPPQVNISTEFEANFGSHNVTFSFKATGNQDVSPGHVKLVKRGNKMEIIL